MTRTDIFEFDVLKTAQEFVRGDAINLGGDHYIVYTAIKTAEHKFELRLRSLPFPDKDYAILTVNPDAMFVNNTLHNLEI